MVTFLRLLATACIYISFCTSGTPSSPLPTEPESVTYEEYVVEHAVSSLSAKNAALSTNLNSVVTSAGCQKCSKEEIAYCLGTGLVSDHCCCDMRYEEVLPFVPHTCYVGTQLCKPVATDCAEYQRLRTCCCNRHTLMKWKLMSAGAALFSHKVVLFSLIAFIYLAVIN